MLPVTAHAGETSHTGTSSLVDLTGSGYGMAALALFVVAYGMVIFEEVLHMRKSKPVLTAAGLIWMIIAAAYAAAGDTHTAAAEARHHLLEFSELMLFLLAAMTYINTMEERNIFHWLRAKLVSSGMSLRGVFWVTGLLAFLISPVADNLTTALVMGAVSIAVGAGNKKFVTVSCINIVIAANAGGAFSPFGDITTLMVWQSGHVTFGQFFDLFLPSLINWLVPAFLMSLTIPRIKPQAAAEAVTVKMGGFAVVGLFIATIALTVTIHNTIHLPPVIGMMTGLGLLKLYGFHIKMRQRKLVLPLLTIDTNGHSNPELESAVKHKIEKDFNIFESFERIEWDTLMFFYGVVLCVGGLGTLGYLNLTSHLMYSDLGAMTANVLVGLFSSIVDNIPVMFAVLNMNPEMSHGQWLLVTLTAGVGGSLLSVGSAAGVALMGQARGTYTFMAHMRWSWAVALGYAASIGTHIWINADLM
ncbi:MAG: sodium:proton antiporter [Gammaproteobacteria bacterium]|nr:sodium:proton antiporter [Gammaproteobacteria bacterium]